MCVEGREAEINELHRQVVVCGVSEDNHVRRIEIAMDDALIVYRLQGERQFLGDREALVEAQFFAVQHFPQRSGAVVFEDDLMIDVVVSQRLADVLARKRLVQIELAVIACDAAGVDGARAQRFRDDRALTPGAPGDQRRVTFVDCLIHAPPNYSGPEPSCWRLKPLRA